MNPCSILAVFRISICFGVKLSVILRLGPFRLFLLGKNLFSNIVPSFNNKFHYNWSRFILAIWPGFFFPILCVQSRSACEISMFIFVDIVSVTKSSVTSSLVSTIPWTNKKDFQLSYSLQILFLPSSWLFVLSFLSFSYSSKFVDIKLTASFKSFSCSSPLIWLSLALEVIWNNLFIFSSKFFIQLHKITTPWVEFLHYKKRLWGLLLSNQGTTIEVLYFRNLNYLNSMIKPCASDQ